VCRTEAVSQIHSFLHLAIFNSSSSTSHTMSNADWDTKLVVGQKTKAPKVTKNSADLNGT